MDLYRHLAGAADDWRFASKRSIEMLQPVMKAA
jgi:hypothetical protein